MFKDIKAQLKHIKNTDPAARNTIEILLLYPSVHALLLYRLAHFLYSIKLLFLARFISQFARFITGIEIHPGATIGIGLFIDHGMGVVIGETAVIEDYVKLYHLVTLGGVSNTHEKRHPTIKSHAIIGAGAKVLGNITVGEYARVGANATLFIDVPDYYTAVGSPAKLIKPKNKEL